MWRNPLPLLSFTGSEGSNLTPAHHYGDFRFKTYAPIAFRYFREMFGIRPDDYMVFLLTQHLQYPEIAHRKVKLWRKQTGCEFEIEGNKGVIEELERVKLGKHWHTRGGASDAVFNLYLCVDCFLSHLTTVLRSGYSILCVMSRWLSCQAPGPVDLSSTSPVMMSTSLRLCSTKRQNFCRNCFQDTSW